MAHLLQRSASARVVVGVVVAIVVVVAMIADTTFVTDSDALAIRGSEFDPQEYTDRAFPEISGMIIDQAVPLPELAAKVAEDPAAAGAEHGQDMGAGRFTYAVSVTGTVVEVDEGFVYLEVPDMSATADVRIPMGSALSGNPVRDATGTIAFGDFPDQNDYQSVANFLRRKMLSEVIEPLDPPSLVGQTLQVHAGWVTGGPAETYLVMPVAIEVIS